jgi:hypothetical protein
MSDDPLMTPAEFGARILQTAEWVVRHQRDIPHRRVGRSIGFTEQDYTDYLESVRVAPVPMRSKSRKKS